MLPTHPSWRRAPLPGPLEGGVIFVGKCYKIQGFGIVFRLPFIAQVSVKHLCNLGALSSGLLNPKKHLPQNHRITEVEKGLQGPQIQPLTKHHHFPPQPKPRAEPAEGDEAFPCWSTACTPRIWWCFGRDRHFKPPFTVLISMVGCTDVLMVVFFTQIRKLGCNNLNILKNLLYWLNIHTSPNQ